MTENKKKFLSIFLACFALSIFRLWYSNFFELPEFTELSAKSMFLTSNGTESLFTLKLTQAKLNALSSKVYSEKTSQYYANQIDWKKLNAVFSESVHSGSMVMMGDTSLGFANKMYIVLNCMFVAVIKRSSLFLTWNDIPNYIKIPIPTGVYFNQPETFENRVRDKNSVVKQFGVQTANMWNSIKNASVLYKRIPGNIDAYKIQMYHAIFFELASNPAYFDLLLDLGLVSNEVVAQARLLYELEKVQTVDNKLKVETLFDVGFSFAHNVLTNIWVPNEVIKAKINKYVEENFKNKYVIGLQMRFSFMQKPHDLTKFLDCAIEHEKYVEEKLKIESKSIKWFIAGDHEGDVETIRKGYPERVITTWGRIVDVGFTNEGYERVIIDNELLSKCDELVITGGSTFGAVAAMRAGRMPLYLNVELNNPNCSRMNFSGLPKRGTKTGQTFSSF
jgi:hypothetical protein